MKEGRLNGEVVRRLRVHCGLSQQMLASLSGVPKVAIARIEQGFDTPFITLANIFSLGRVLDVPVEKLVGGHKVDRPAVLHGPAALNDLARLLPLLLLGRTVPVASLMSALEWSSERLVLAVHEVQRLLDELDVDVRIVGGEVIVSLRDTGDHRMAVERATLSSGTLTRRQVAVINRLRAGMKDSRPLTALLQWPDVRQLIDARVVVVAPNTKVQFAIGTDVRWASELITLPLGKPPVYDGTQGQSPSPSAGPSAALLAPRRPYAESIPYMAVRTWARARGIPVAAAGTIRRDVIDAYVAANRTES